MNKSNEIISLGKVDSVKSEKKKHMPSTIQADTLFTFTNKLDYIIQPLKSGFISPRYCDENISYLKIPKIKKIAFPMKCFCDINMHRLDVHLEWYGYYGLAFSKEWGMKKAIQPVQYINPDSSLRKDFTTAFSAAIKNSAKKGTTVQRKIENFMLNELMYYKPYDGKMINRTTGKNSKKCFTDECEWRYIPDITVIGYEQVYYDQDILKTGVFERVFKNINNSIIGNPNVALKFDYSDLKYIIVKSTSDFILLSNEINSWGLEKQIEQLLISKIIIWDNSRGDF
ncbi:MAG: abortive infection system antitoxin AbiGi family protein [Candidatus Gastranaerophilaceae bacterium]